MPLIQGSRAKVLQNHICTPGELAKDLLAAREMEIQRNRFLVAIDAENGALQSCSGVFGTRGPNKRQTSPVTGNSHLMTSAPKSANSAAATGPAYVVHASSTTIPSKGPGDVALTSR
jgi:hypothetical protein